VEKGELGNFRDEKDLRGTSQGTKGGEERGVNIKRKGGRWLQGRDGREKNGDWGRTSKRALYRKGKGGRRTKEGNSPGWGAWANANRQFLG